MKSALLLAVIVCSGASTLAQAQTSDSREYNQMPTLGVNVVSRTTRAVKYAPADQATAEAQRQQQNAEADSDRNRAAAADANQATVEAQQGQRNAEAESERNQLAAANSDEQRNQAVQGREALRAELLQQFNVIFTTRDAARGFIAGVMRTLPSTLADTKRMKLPLRCPVRFARLDSFALHVRTWPCAASPFPS